MKLLSTVMVLIILPALALADGVNIRPDIASVSVDADGTTVEISRNPDQENKLSGEWARTSRPVRISVSSR